MNQFNNTVAIVSVEPYNNDDAYRNYQNYNTGSDGDWLVAIVSVIFLWLLLMAGLFAASESTQTKMVKKEEAQKKPIPLELKPLASSRLPQLNQKNELFIKSAGHN